MSTDRPCGMCQRPRGEGSGTLKLPGKSEISLCVECLKNCRTLAETGIGTLVEMGVPPALIQKGYAAAKASAPVIQGLKDLFGIYQQHKLEKKDVKP